MTSTGDERGINSLNEDFIISRQLECLSLIERNGKHTNKLHNVVRSYKQWTLMYSG